MDKSLDLKNKIIKKLDSNKALDIVSIDLEGKSSIADYMIIASGTSSRHIQALSEQVYEELKSNGIINCKIEGKDSTDWKLVDGIDLVVHIFNPEKRKFYELEKMWSELIPQRKSDDMKKISYIIFFLILFLSNFKNLSANETDIYKKIDLFSEVLEKINNEYVEDVNQSDAMDAAINGVLQSLDPYSSYMSPEMLQEMQTETKGEFGGLGIEVGMEAGVVKVISPIDGSPAEAVGVKAGDYIVKIDGTQVQGKTLSEAVDLMRGPVGSEIEITVRRIGTRKALTFNIVRDIIEIKSVKSKVLEDSIGYVRLTSFNDNSSDQLENIVKDFKKNKKINKYILDLRNNPGGLLNQAIRITDFFLE